MIKFILVILSSLLICLGADFDSTTVSRVIVTIEYEYGYKELVVLARVWWKVGCCEWYVLADDGTEHWSDKYPRRVREK